MLAFNEAVLRSVKLSSPALSPSGSSGSDEEEEEDGVIQPEQNRSHQLIESMLSSSPPQPTYSHHHHHHTHPHHHHSHSQASSSSSSPEALSKPPSSTSSPTSPRSPRSTDPTPPPTTTAPPPPPAAPNTTHVRAPPRLSDPSHVSPLPSAPSSAPHSPSDPLPPSPPRAPIPRRKTAITEPPPPLHRTDASLTHPPRDPAGPTPPVAAPVPPPTVSPPAAAAPACLNVDVSAALTDATAAAAVAALASPTAGTPRIIVSKSSTLSASMFSKEEVLSPPSLAAQSSLSKELTESGLFRPTRPYSASANSSPAAPYRGVREGRDGFASTGGFPPLDAFPPAPGLPLALSPALQKSSSATNSPAPPTHRRTRSRGHTASSSVTLLRVFPSVDQPPMQVVVPIHCPVQRVVELCLSQYREEARQPLLRFDTPDAYELRVLDDDDGTPDDDMPPLDRHRAIQEYGVDAVAFVEVADYVGSVVAALSPSSAAQLKASAGQQAMEQKRGTGGGGHPPPLQTVGSVSSPSSLSSMSAGGSRWDEVLSPRSAALPYSTAPSPIPSHPPTPMAGSRPPSSSPSSRVKVTGGKVSLRVVLADMETHMLLVAADTRLEELLPLISRKKSSQMQPEHWKFLYPPPEEGEEFEVAYPAPTPARPAQRQPAGPPLHPLHQQPGLRRQRPRSAGRLSVATRAPVLAVGPRAGHEAARAPAGAGRAAPTQQT